MNHLFYLIIEILLKLQSKVILNKFAHEKNSTLQNPVKL